MNRILLLTVALALAALGGFMAFASPNQDPATPHQGVALPGLTAKDAFPNGCVSCHVDLGEGKDHRLSVDVAKIKGHPKLTVVATVPKDCGKCHKADSKTEALNTLMHRVHYGKLAESAFVKNYQGACLNCHSLDPKTGIFTMKSGPKNW